MLACNLDEHRDNIKKASLFLIYYVSSEEKCMLAYNLDEHHDNMKNLNLGKDVEICIILIFF